MLINKINYQEIEAIIFDLGGVIIEVDMNYPYDVFLNKSPRSNQELLLELRAIARCYEIGEIDNQKFISTVKNIIAIDYTDQEIKDIWNGMLGEIPKELGDILHKVKREKKTFILSNTNPIHVQEMEKRFKRSISKYSLESLFDKIYYSHKIGLHKPDPQIFEYVITENNLNPAKTLFIDDNVDNINSAHNYGLQVFHMNPPMMLPTLFAENF